MKPRLVRTTSGIVLAALAVGTSAWAQTQGRDNVGRSGWFWQAPMRLEAEKWEAFTSELEGASLDEWRERAIAWVTLVLIPSDPGPEFEIVESYRLARPLVERAEVESLGPSRWRLRFERKPKRLLLQLSDVDSTEVKCSWPRSSEGSQTLHVGVFVVEGEVVCLDHPAEPSTPAENQELAPLGTGSSVPGLRPRSAPRRAPGA